MITPNGDGVNDQAEIRFVVFKVVAAAPQVGVYDLGGKRVAQMERVETGPEELFTWEGTRADGGAVPPGIYLWRLDLGADSGDDIVQGTIAVGY